MKTAFAILLSLFTTGCSLEHDASPKLTRPKSILVIRHAEKPADAVGIHLSPEGTKRAEALPALFKMTDTRPNPFPTPDFVFAAKASKHSNRPVETITPLAKALKLDINAEYANDNYASLAEELYSNQKYEGKTVLICWHHGMIPELAVMLGATEVPDKWKDPVFDRVWQVTFDDKGKAKSLVKRHQALMPGDGKRSCGVLSVRDQDFARDAFHDVERHQVRVG